MTEEDLQERIIMLEEMLFDLCRAYRDVRNPIWDEARAVLNHCDHVNAKYIDGGLRECPDCGTVGL